MGDVGRVLHRLHPVAVQVWLPANELADAALACQHVPAGEQRRRLRAHVDPQDAGELLHGIGCLLHTLLVRAARWLERLLEALALRIVLPAMIRAADAAVLYEPVSEGRAAVGAV